jgi:mannose-6-phosphate isomerase-like protein (cupin superfamily)
MTGMLKNVDSAEHYRWGQVCDGWRLLERSDLSVIQESIPPGAGELTHYHGRARQLFYVLSGELRIQMGEQRFRLTVGDSLEIPPGEPHRVRNEANVDAMFLVISAPTTRGDRVDLE